MICEHLNRHLCFVDIYMLCLNTFYKGILKKQSQYIFFSQPFPSVQGIASLQPTFLALYSNFSCSPEDSQCPSTMTGLGQPQGAHSQLCCQVQHLDSLDKRQDSKSLWIKAQYSVGQVFLSTGCLLSNNVVFPKMLLFFHTPPYMWVANLPSSGMACN